MMTIARFASRAEAESVMQIAQRQDTHGRYWVEGIQGESVHIIWRTLDGMTAYPIRQDDVQALLASRLDEAERLYEDK